MAQQLSKIVIQKKLASVRKQSGSVVVLVRAWASGILPRRPDGRGGASVVRRTPLETERRIRMTSAASTKSSGSTASVLDAKSGRNAFDKTVSAPSESKQSRVIALLRKPGGSTVDHIMKVTGWQKHSVRGFLTAVVRKRLKLKLTSNKVDGSRVYQIAAVDQSKTRRGRSKKATAGGRRRAISQ